MSDYDEFPKISKLPQKGRKKQKFKQALKDIDLKNVSVDDLTDDEYYNDEDYMKK